MSRDQVAGAAVLHKLRERITSGCYLGHWQPGQRLPSIRTIAAAEGVDRKTAAAAYRHLQEEGRVEVHARSGVYLKAMPLAPPRDPLERLYRQWLGHTYEGARSLGLDTASVLRLLNMVAEVERIRLPVVECEWVQAEALSSELRERLNVRAAPCILEELRPGNPLVAEAPILVTTPYHSGDVALLAPGTTLVEATLSPRIFRELRERLERGRVLVIAGSRTQLDKLRRGFEQHHPEQHRRRTRLVAAEDGDELRSALGAAEFVFLWPGAPSWVESAIPPETEWFRPVQSLSGATMSQLQAALLHEAIRRVKYGAGEKVRAG